MTLKSSLKPAGLLALRILVASFTAEVCVMLLLAWVLPPLGDWLGALVDSALLTLLIAPLVWYWLVGGERQRLLAVRALQKSLETLQDTNQSLVKSSQEKQLLIQTLHGSEARYRSVVDSANDAIVTINTAGEIRGWSGAAEKIFQYNATEMLGQPLIRILPAAGHDHFLIDLQLIQAGGSPRLLGQVVELAGLRKDGIVFPMDLSVTEWSVSNQKFFTGTIRDITKRKRDEETLRLQGAALSAAANAILITNRDGAIMWVNSAFTTLTGYTLAEAVGKNPRDLMKSGQHGLEIYQALWETLLAGHVWRGEMVNRRKDGSLYPEEQTITPVRDAAGMITHFIAIKQDLTARQLAEQTVQASRRQFQAVFEQASVGMVIAEGQRGRFLNVNRCFCEIVGYSSEELLHLCSHDITHPEDVPADTDQLDQISFGVIREFSREKRYRKKDGTTVWTRVFVAPLDPTEMHPTVRIGVIEDITERKLAEAALHQSEERYRLLFENNPLPMWLYDVETLRFLAVNESAIQHYGYSREEFLGMSVKEIRPEEDIPALLKSIKEGREQSMRVGGRRHRQKDGTIIQVETISRPLTFAGRAARIVLASDITEKKLLEGKFLHAQRLESVGMLAAGIAHDLNNVLAPIVLVAPLLRPSLSDPRDLKILSTLEQSAERGAGLVKQILAFAHTSTGEFQPIQVKHLAKDIISLMEETFPKSVQLQQKVTSDLWLVQGNATQIHQVLLNLCVNARDAMPEGGTLRLAAANRRLSAIEASAIPGARSGDWLMLEIADTGTGIPPEVMECIWEPFFTTKGEGKGTGLGLSTVRGIVASHHGFLELETEVGRGTTFRVFLPAVESGSPRPRSASPFDIPDGHGELVLVVDDDAAIREVVADLLVSHGYRVACCSDGIEAITMLGTHSNEVSLVMTDADMPRLGGAALIRASLRLRSDLRVIGMSGLFGDESDGSEIQTVQKLAHAFLRKPFKPEELLSAVHRLISK